MDSDPALLRRFAENGDEAAFAEIIRRQMDFVYSVALRVTNNGALAQDVAQAVFTLLARRARALTHYQTLAGWLHTTTRHTAINAVRGEERRRAREQESAAMQITDITAASAVDWDQLRPLLDEAVGSLREDDRQAVLLRFFHNQSHQQVGAALGLSEDSARKRTERALEKLHAYFSKRGVATTAAVLATVITSNSVQAAPTGLVANVTAASLTSATAPLAASASLTMLGGLIMNAKIKIAALAVVLVLLALLMKVKFSPAEESPAASPASAPAPVAKAAAQPLPAPPSRPTAQPAPTAPAQVVQPAVQPAPVVASTPATSGSAALAAANDSRTEINAAMNDFVGLLQSGSYAAAVGTYMQLPANISGEQLVESLQKNPDFPNTIQMMIDATNAAQTSMPVYNDTGDLATYKLPAPTDGKTMVRWKKIDGKWFVDAFE